MRLPNISEWVELPGGTYNLGWRFTEFLPSDVRDAAQQQWGTEAFERRFSPLRSVELASIRIARAPTKLAELLDVYEMPDEVETIAQVCALIDEELATAAMRLPTEDEFEAACGPGMLFLGDKIPDGSPYSNRHPVQEFEGPLTFLTDSYTPELVRNVLKMGDGGQVVCGAQDDALAWLTLATSLREFASSEGNPADADLLYETLEETYVRPVAL